ncbi:MAG: hypothetical protein KGI25_03910 [Thaumarchaeota archaeon]|nr:hypothetical protein [Nitrososphaerota archaeon]
MKTKIEIESMFKYEQKKTEKPDYLVGREWSDLQKAWKEYKNAQESSDDVKITSSAKRIQNLQKKLGMKVTDFQELRV